MKKTTILTVALLTMLGVAAQGATITKQDNTINLDTAGSWSAAPTAGDIGQWDSTVTGPNTTVLGSDMTLQGIKIVNPGGLVTINSGNTLTLGAAAIDIDMTTATRNLTLNNDVSLGAANSWNVLTNRTLTVGGTVTGSGALTKDGYGTVILNGNNSTYSGAITVNSGVLSIGHSSALGDTVGTTTLVGTGLSALYLSGGISVAETIILNGAAAHGPTGHGNLRNVSGVNTWAGAISTSNSPRIGADAGSTLNITGGLTIATTRNVNFTGDGDIVVSSIIAKAGSGGSTALESIGKSLGTGTTTFGGTAANTYDGTTTINEGTLLLDYTGGENDKLANTTSLSVFRLSGGTLAMQGATAAGFFEVVSSTAVLGGASSVTRIGGTSVLQMNAIARTVGGTVNFGADSIANTDTVNVNGILGTTAYATVAGADWAMNSTGGADGAITAYSGYTTDTAPGTWAATENISLTTSPTAIAGNTTINSLRLTGASAVTIDPTFALTLSSGGLLVTGSGATSIAPSSGTATLLGAPGTSQDLIVHQYSSADLTISAIIANNGTTSRLTKSGPGKLILTGANTYSGPTHINAGVLSVSANNNLGDPATGASIQFFGGTLQATATFALDNGGLNPRTLTFNDQVGSKIDVTSGNALTVSGTVNGRGWLTKIGSGTLILTGSGSTTYQGEVTVSDGALLVNTPGFFSAPVVTVASGATLGGNGAIGYPPAAIVGNSTVNIQNGGTLAPGASAGTLTLTADLNLASSAVLSYELKGNDTTVGGGLNDLTTVNGALKLDGILNVTEIGAGSFLSAILGDKWRLFDYNTDAAFGLTDNGLDFGSMPTLSGVLTFGIDTTTPGQVNLVVIPEPSTVVLGLLGGLGLLVVLRRRRSA